VRGAEPDIGRALPLDRDLTVGRDPAVELPLSDESISRRHCRFRRDGAGTWLLEDLGSTNGTTLNDRPCLAPTSVAVGDRVLLGETLLKVTAWRPLEADFHRKVEELVGVDELTGLHSRRRFEGALALHLAEAERSGGTVSLLMLDLDGLKSINDTYGHPVGARVIARTGRVIRRILDERLPGAIAARLGGDEFGVCLPATGRQEAEWLAEAIRSAVERERDGSAPERTVSIGGATFPDDGAGGLLLSIADRRLSVAKKNGRNRVDFSS
jgi:diguanylate cyclase (GGDEF)-like protein